MGNVYLTSREQGITPDQLGWCLAAMKEYPYAVKVLEVPAHEQMTQALKVRDWVHIGEDCMGNRTETLLREPQWRAIMQGFFGPRDVFGYLVDKRAWLFFKDEDDHKAFCSTFAYLVLDAYPFVMTTSVLAEPKVELDTKRRWHWDETYLAACVLLIVLVVGVIFGYWVH